MSLSAEQRYSLKYKALHYFYQKDYSQTEIANMLGISRNTLGKLLKEGKQEGMVKIEIVDVHNSYQLVELEIRLKEKFNLQDVVIVDCAENLSADVSERIAAQAAVYIERIVQSNMKIGIGWGRTLEKMVRYIKPNPKIADVEVVTLIGGAGTSSSRIQPNIIVQQLLEKFAGNGYIINAPYLCRTAELCAALKREPHIREIMDKARHADISIVGIGEKPSASSCEEMGYEFSLDNIATIQQGGAVGDICCNFIDENGNPLQIDINDRLISITLQEIKSMNKVIALSGGPNKVVSVLGALRGGYIDVLITDKFTAKSVLKNADID